MQTVSLGKTGIQLSAIVMAELDRIGRTVTDHLDDNPMLWDF